MWREPWRRRRSGCRRLSWLQMVRCCHLGVRAALGGTPMSTVFLRIPVPCWSDDWTPRASKANLSNEEGCIDDPAILYAWLCLPCNIFMRLWSLCEVLRHRASERSTDCERSLVICIITGQRSCVSGAIVSNYSVLLSKERKSRKEKRRFMTAPTL